MREPLLVKEASVNSTYSGSCRHLTHNTFIPFVVTLTGVVALSIGYAHPGNSLSYDGYLSPYWKTLNPKYSALSNPGIPTATLVLFVWTIILFISNIFIGCIVGNSKYYISPSTHKSYIMTSVVLLSYSLTLWFHADLIAVIIPGIFLYKFVGIEA
eukprot:344735_1